MMNFDEYEYAIPPKPPGTDPRPVLVPTFLDLAHLLKSLPTPDLAYHSSPHRPWAHEDGGRVK